MTATNRFQQGSLIAAMFIGSVGMWLGAPAFWLWLASQGGMVSQSSMNSLLMVLIGIPVTMVIIGKFLARLDHRYNEQFGRSSAGKYSAARWLHSARGGTDLEEPSMLDKILVISIALAGLAFGVFFVFFSHGSQARL